METNLQKKKRELYAAILDMPWNQLSDNEIDIAQLLAKDKDIQKHLSRCAKKKG